MSAFKQKMAKTGARAWLLAVVAVAALALSGIGASSASAACAGAEVAGQGSSLQKTAQIGWTGAFNTTEGGDCATYTSSSSGTGMNSWGASGGAIERAWSYIGTDDAPNATQIGNIKTAAGAGSHLRVIPVAQAAIAIIAHPPVNCTVSQITQTDLEHVWQGTTTTWSDLSTKTEDPTEANPKPCEKHIKRIVRKDSSGTTFQFKRFLFKINNKSLDCVSKTWKTLAEPANNLVWPESCEGTTLNTIAQAPATGGGSLAETVLEDEGTIGYVDGATAKSKGNQVLEVQNGVESFASPYTEAGGKHKANCEKASYTVPAEARETGTGEDVEWTEVTGSALETTTYPICTLTWDLAFKNYATAGFGAGVGTTVMGYLTYVTGATGQGELEQNWYAPLPTGTGASTNVLTAAKFATEGVS